MKGGIKDRHFIDWEELSLFASKVLQACGLPASDSKRAAKALAHADLRGIDSHGIINLSKIYVPKLLNQDINPIAKLSKKVQNKSLTLIDGDNGLGLVVAQEAMQVAIEQAQIYGCGITCVQNSSHFGSAGYYALQAAQNNMLGISMTNCGRKGLLRPPGGLQKMLGSNPIAVAAPGGKQPAFLLDMSTAIASEGKIAVTRMKEEEVPEGWLVDEMGNSISGSEADKLQQGFPQFLGSKEATAVYKGFGLGIMVDLLSGIMAGAGIGTDDSALNPENGNDLKQNIGHFLMAIDIGKLIDLELFIERADVMLEGFLNCERIFENEQVVYPGYRGSKVTEERQKTGIPLCTPVYTSLVELAEKFSIPLPDKIAPE